jgi:hypothetical protein
MVVINGNLAEVEARKNVDSSGLGAICRKRVELGIEYDLTFQYLIFHS